MSGPHHNINGWPVAPLDGAVRTSPLGISYQIRSGLVRAGEREIRLSRGQMTLFAALGR